ALVHHDLRQMSCGLVLRTVRRALEATTTTLELAHGCVACPARGDLLPRCRPPAAHTVVERVMPHLHGAMHPVQVCRAAARVVAGDRTVGDDVEITAVTAAVDASTFVDDVTGDDTMAERGLHGSPDDERTVAHVALAQAEFADVLVCAGRPADAWSAARTNAILERVAPSAPVLDLAVTDLDTLLATVPAHARRGTGDDPHGSLLRGQPPLHSDCGMTVTV